MMAPDRDRRRLRIGVLHHDERQRRVLRSIADRLRARHDVTVTDEAGAIVAFNPQVIVTGEDATRTNFRFLLPFALVVRVRLGFASKADVLRPDGPGDFLCVASHTVRTWLQAGGVEPRREFWVTGSPLSDALLDAGAPPLPFQPPAGKKVVLYAPTAKTWLTSVHLLGLRALELLKAGRDDVFVVIWPDGQTATRQGEWLRAIRAAAAERDDVFVAGDSDGDLTPLLTIADVLVTDVADAMFPYLALDRPIVLLTNPGYRGATDFDPNAFAWLWRDLGEEVHDRELIPAAIARALDQPDARAELRRTYRRKLFDDFNDAGSAERAALRIDRLNYETAGPLRMALQAAWSKVARLLVRRVT